MATPKAIILSGYGLNCEEETAAAFEFAGGKADIVHINDLVDGVKDLRSYQILAIPGGFSYGDDTGSGKAYANKMNNHLRSQLADFVSRDKLVIGICNGFQILTQTGLVPGALTANKNARYLDRWVDLVSRVTVDTSPWLSGITSFSLPIAHGEGRYYAGSDIIKELKQTGGIALTYAKGEICRYQNLEANPNGAMLDIAAITSHNGRVLGMMPHPERAMFFTQLPNWPVLKERIIRAGKQLPKYGQGFQLFVNAIKYFG